MKKTVCTFLFSLASMAVLTACSSQHIQPTLLPGAQSVKIGIGGVPKGCQWRGDVNSGATEYVAIKDHQQLQAKQFTLLRNQAIKLGANAVIITEHNAKYYKQYIIATGDVAYGIDIHEVKGRAYQCSASALSQIKSANLHHP